MKGQGLYNVRLIISAVFMSLSLLWLTVSLPYVYESQKDYEISTSDTGGPVSDPVTDEETPLNTTEEKASTSTTAQEEYLHHENENLLLGSQFLSHKCLHNPTVYIAFYGELISPPPDYNS